MERLGKIASQLSQKDINPFLKKNGNLKGKTIVISGASRGIGLAMAKRFAKDGANIAILAKTDTPHPRLPGTIHTAAEEIRKLGGNALPIKCDIRFEDQAQSAIDLVVKTYGGIDVLINNASAIKMKTTDSMTMKEFDLIHTINVRGTFMMARLCTPYLMKSSNGHILTCSPPIVLNPDYLGGSVGYLISKTEMSMLTLGLSKELSDDNVGVNSLWPRTTIATAAVEYELGGEAMMRTSRTDEIQADAAYEIITSDSKVCTGNLWVDDEVLKLCGVTDFKKYLYDKTMNEDDLTIII